MRFGMDEYGRYCERGGQRLAVERWPFKQARKRFPACCWLGLWWLSKQTGWGWQGTTVAEPEVEAITK